MNANETNDFSQELDSEESVSGEVLSSDSNNESKTSDIGDLISSNIDQSKEDSDTQFEDTFSNKQAKSSPESSIYEATQSEKPQKSVEQLTSERELLDKKKLVLDEELNRLEKAAQQLSSWEDRHARSFLWRTLQNMNRNLGLASSKLSEYNQIVDQLVIPDPGTMIILRKKFHKKLLISTSVLSVITALVFILPRIWIFPTISRFFNTFLPTIQNPLTLILQYSIVIFLVYFFSAIIGYYRGWSNFQRKVELTLWNLNSVSLGVNHVRSEEIRLKSLYPQVKEWLEILGNSLSNPWHIRDEWFAAENRNLNSQSIPYSLRLAQPSEDDSAADIAMQREIAERFMVRGWRAKVFADQIDVIRESVGMPEERLNVDQIDRDISYSPNGPRALVYRYITDAEILEKVGRRELLPLIAEVQRDAILETHPPVTELRKSKLSSEAKNSSSLYEEKKTQWDEFLSSAIPTPSKPSTPFSVLALSNEGRLRNYQDNYETFMILPQRMRSLVDHLESSHVRTYEEDAKLPLDIVVRTDFTGPIARDHLLFLVKSDEVLADERSEIEKQLQERLRDRSSGI